MKPSMRGVARKKPEARCGWSAARIYPRARRCAWWVRTVWCCASKPSNRPNRQTGTGGQRPVPVCCLSLRQGVNLEQRLDHIPRLTEVATVNLLQLTGALRLAKGRVDQQAEVFVTAR